MDEPLRPRIEAALKYASVSAASLPFYDDDTTASISDEFGADPGKDPRFRKIVEAVLFSRSLLLTYNVVLLLLLVAFALAQWGGIIQRAYQRRAVAKKARKEETGRATVVDKNTKDVRAQENTGSSASSSSSSTLEGNASPPDVPKDNRVVDEREPLLSTHPRPKATRPDVLMATLHSIKAWLVYQPRPIPIVNKTLPSNSASLVILGFIGLNVFYLFYRLPLSLPMVFVFADRCGMLFAANLPILYLFAAKNQPITWLTGYSYETLNIFHRRLGEVMCFIALLHGAGMLSVWYMLLRPLGFTFARFALSRVILPGIGALFAYELIYFTSLGSFRQRCYEVFLFLHVALQTAALVLLWLHHSRSRIYVGVALIVFLVDRLVYRLGLKSTTMRADLSILNDGQTVMVSANWSVPKSKMGEHLYRRTVLQGWNAPDHVFVTVPALGHKHIIQAHPYTIASPAPSKPPVSIAADESSKHAWMNVLVRAQNGFSRDLLNYAQTHSSAEVRLDGPYGSTNTLDLLRQSQLAIVVAGGSGVAVAFPLLWALLNPTVRSDLEGQDKGSARDKQKVCFLWVVHSRSHLSWLPRQRLDELREWGADIVVPEPTDEAGRPDVGGIVSDWVDEYTGGRSDKTGVVVSGPDGMNRDTRNACGRLVGRGKNVSVSVEKFGW